MTEIKDFPAKSIPEPTDKLLIQDSDDDSYKHILIEDLPSNSDNSPVKAWGIINGTTGALIAGQNVQSTSRIGAGDYWVYFPTSFFADSDYAILLTCYKAGGNNDIFGFVDSFASNNQVRIRAVLNSVRALVDPARIYFQVLK